MNDPKLREKFGAGKMSDDMHSYDIFPKVFIEGDPATVTIRPLGWHSAFSADREYTLSVHPRDERNYPTPTGETQPSAVTVMKVRPDADGCIRFSFTFHGEQAWYVRIAEEIGPKQPPVRLSVYSLHEDMRGRYPLRGDLHLHSRHSDGREDPAVMVANYRKGGYDFLAVTDHHRYYGSLAAARAYKDVPIDLNIVPGEECHLPGNAVHIVSFGGLWSVNALVDSCPNNTEFGTEPAVRAAGPDCPAIMTEESFRAEVMALAAQTDIPEGVDPYTYAACLWVFRRIREADGLSVFAHPYWITGFANHIDERLTDALFASGEFDAFEVLGGETYLDQNENQVYKYMQMRLRGFDTAVVGSSDSHCSINNPGWNVGQTIAFAHENERRSIISAIRDRYSVAVDNISREARLAGDFRFVRYGRFLLDYYFPLHDELCFEEGRLMKDYHTGTDPRAGEQLRLLFGRTQAMREKYFAF